MDSHKEWRSTLEDQEKLKRLKKRKKWLIEQQSIIKHEERKLQMIKEYEKKRAKAMQIDYKQTSLRRSKSNSPQRRETSSSDYEHFKERKASMTIKDPDDTIIDKRELHKIKISIIRKSNFSTKDQQSMSTKIERDIINLDDIILPRRQNEGSHPIFERNEIKKAKKTQTVGFSQDEQLEKQLAISEKSAYTDRRSIDDDITPHYYDSSPYKRTIHREGRTSDNDRYKRDRRSSSRDSKEKDRGRNERRDRSPSRYSRRSITRNRSRSRCRSHSPASQQAKKGKVDSDKNKFSSRINYLDRSSKYQDNHTNNRTDNRTTDNHTTDNRTTDNRTTDNRTTENRTDNRTTDNRTENRTDNRTTDNRTDNRTTDSSTKIYISSDNFYNPYVYRPMLMPRIQAPSMLVPAFPRAFPAPFPPMNMYRWQQPPLRLTYGRGINQKLR